MSIWLRWQNHCSRSLSWAGQAGFGQKILIPSLSTSTGCSHFGHFSGSFAFFTSFPGRRSCRSPCSRTGRRPPRRPTFPARRPSRRAGQAAGASIGFAPFGRFSTSASTTYGITSPARSTTTVSPRCRPSRRIWSMLCSVTCVTVTPPIMTGSRSPTGVRLPPLPTCHRQPSSVVGCCSVSYLNAIAHRGALLVTPSFSRWAKLSTLMTIPSVMYGSFGRTFSNSWIPLRTASTSAARLVSAGSGRPHCRSSCVHSQYELDRQRLDLPQPVGQEPQLPLGDHLRVQPPQRAGRAVPRVLVRFLAGRPPILCSPSGSRRCPCRPRRGTSSTPGTPSPRNASGTDRIVRALAVMSSPVFPRPRVAPSTSLPSSYRSDTDAPSIFGSSTYAGVAPSPSVRRTRSSNARTSASVYVLSMLIIGTACRTDASDSCTSPPTRCVGEAAVRSSGWAASSSVSSAISPSYSPVAQRRPGLDVVEVVGLVQLGPQFRRPALSGSSAFMGAACYRTYSKPHRPITD